MVTDPSARRGRHVPTEQDVCGSCGVVAYPGETFCVSCGAYRGWDTAGGTPAASPVAGPVPPAAEHGQHRPTGGFPGSPGGPGPYPGRTEAPGGDPATASTRIVSGEIVLRTAPAEDGPGGPAVPPPPGGAVHVLPCPQCGGPNEQSRTYCHPCGALLRPEPEPEEPAPTRWERLRARYFDRPEVWHWDRRWGAALVALPLYLAAGVSVGGAAAAAQESVPRVKDRFLSPYAVSPDAVSASSSAKGFEPELASDGVDNRAWAPQGTGEDAVGQSWTAEFATPFRLTSLLVINGAATAPRQFAETGRPTKIEVTAVTGRGTVEKVIELGGQPGPQRFDLGIDGVTRVRVTIRAVNPGLKPDRPVAMAEIQFFSRRDS